jgi:hypothetical protein
MEINAGNEWYGVFTVLDPGSRAFLLLRSAIRTRDRGSGMKKNPDPRYEIRDPG